MFSNKRRPFLLLALFAISASGYAQNDFDSGTEAFRAERYSEALEFFLAARQNGNESPGLTYNTALSYYKLGRFDEAAKSFEQLLSDDDWRDLARFHLGMVAEKNGNLRHALNWYESVLEQSESPKLRRLANQKINRLQDDVSETSQEDDRLTVFFNVSTGFDDNAFSLQNDIQANSSDGEDTYNELFAWMQYYLQGTSTNGWRVHGFAYTRRYSDFDSLDLDVRSAAVSHHRQMGGWQSEWGVSLATTDLDGEDLTDQKKLLIRFQRPLKASSLRLSYTPVEHEGGSGFSHLEGRQHLAEARWQIPMETLRFDLVYRFEQNDRDDLITANEFFSFSPTRHALALGVGWSPRNHWQFSAGLEYRVSEYDGTNRMTDSDGVFRQRTRDADRFKLRLNAQRQISRGLRLSGQVQWIDNQENFETYTYDKTELRLALEYLL